MKLKIKLAVIAIFCIATVTFLSGCSLDESPYEQYNEENYTVSVKFDANGGTFTTNTSVIVDSYNISEMKEENGIVSIPLLAPDDSERNKDAFTAIRNDYFLAGWYASRTESEDSEGKKVYTYSDKWDFESDRLKVAKDGEYSSETPQLTLYAVWAPLFEVKFHNADDGKYISSYIFNPTETDEILVPAWDDETGALEMHEFPENKGHTFDGAFYDKDMKKPVEGGSLTHPGKVNLETGEVEDNVLDLYINWRDGEWYRIYTAEQLSENASVGGCYEIMADLDFSEENWPTSFMYNNFNGKILGNGHKISNVSVTQTNNSKVNAGLFGNLTESATLSNITFENITFTVKAGTRVVGTSYGLFAGTISSDAAIENVALQNSTLCIDSACYFGVDDYSIGLICGMGDPSVITAENISCKAVGDEPEKIKVTADGNTVTVEEVTE